MHLKTRYRKKSLLLFGLPGESYLYDIPVLHFWVIDK